MARRSKPEEELAVGTTIVSAVPCGVASIILTGASTTECSIKLYNHAATATGKAIKSLITNEAISAVYTPSKPDGFTVGVVAVVAGTGAKGYVSIEPV